MWRRSFTMVALCLGLIPFGQEPATPQAGLTLVKAGRVLDVKSGHYLLNQGIFIADDRIKQVGAFDAVRAAAPKNAKIIDLSNATILPGLIDCHAHLLDAWDQGSGDNVALSVMMGPSKRALLGAANAREDLEAGLTTVRNVGHSGIDGDVALRDSVENGWVTGPRILASARKLTPPGGQAISGWPPLLKPIIDAEFLPVNGPQEARRAVRENLAAGADFIKVVVDALPRVLDLDEMKGIVDEAHRSGVKVAAHATTKLGIEMAIQAGVDSIEHGDEVTDEQFQAMHDKSIFLVPTLWQSETFFDIVSKKYVASDSDKADFERWKKTNDEQSLRKVAGAKKYGVKLAAGSDMILSYPGKTRGQATLLMLDAMEHFGVPAQDVLRAATVDAAELLGWQDRVGVIEAGKFADLIAVDGDPLKSVTELHKVNFVMKAGAIVRDDSRHNPK
jgi:imidazolonepropionase-like amidohydrolase